MILTPLWPSSTGPAASLLMGASSNFATLMATGCESAHRQAEPSGRPVSSGELAATRPTQHLPSSRHQRTVPRTLRVEPPGSSGLYAVSTPKSVTVVRLHGIGPIAVRKKRVEPTTTKRPHAALCLVVVLACILACHGSAPRDVGANLPVKRV